MTGWNKWKAFVIRFVRYFYLYATRTRVCGTCKAWKPMCYSHDWGRCGGNGPGRLIRSKACEAHC